MSHAADAAAQASESIPLEEHAVSVKDQEQEDDGGVESPTEGTEALNSKQRKKKKSKAAAKLRKKLGLGGNNNAEEQSDGKLLASGSSTDGKISDEVVSEVQKAVQQEHGAAAANAVTRANLAKVMAMMNMERDAVLKSQEGKQKAASKAIVDHKFWKTQPVMKPTDAPITATEEEGSIQPSVPPSQVRQDPYPLPSDFQWVVIDVDNPAELKEVYDLLSANYVEDDDATLRFDYSPEFLHWVLKHPGYQKTWHLGVRVVSTKKLVAFISGIPHELRVRNKSYQSTEINFLCVHKKLRSKRLAPVLIKEVTRQCHLTGVFHAIYTVGQVLPTPLSCARYYHRTINAKKLVEVGFSAVPHNMSIESHVRRFELPAQTNLPGMREMETRDVPAVGKLLRRYMKRFDMAPRFSDHEVEHILLSGRGKPHTSVGGGSTGSAAGSGELKRTGQVTWTYVVENSEGKITDMFSFYSLPSSILDNDKHDSLNAAYLFYYATDVAFSNSTETAVETEPVESSTSMNSSERAAALAAGKEAWQCNDLTNLTPTELLDEQNVSAWDKEASSTKQALKQRLNQLTNTLLIIAKQHNFDVVNCLTVMDNALFLADQKFGPGDGFLRFYLFNWRTKPVAGGMGARPGESDLDPVHVYAKSIAAAAAAASASQHADSPSLAQQLVDKASRNPADVGSGNGVVMV